MTTTLASIYAVDMISNLSPPQSDVIERVRDEEGERAHVMTFSSEWCEIAEEVWGIRKREREGEEEREEREWREREMWGEVLYRTCAERKASLSESELEVMKVSFFIFLSIFLLSSFIEHFFRFTRIAECLHGVHIFDGIMPTIHFQIDYHENQLSLFGIPPHSLC